MSTPQNSLPAAGAAPAPQDENRLIIERREKLKLLRQNQADGKGVAFPNDVKPEHRAETLFTQYDNKSKDELEFLHFRIDRVHVAQTILVQILL